MLSAPFLQCNEITILATYMHTSVLPRILAFKNGVVFLIENTEYGKKFLEKVHPTDYFDKQTPNNSSECKRLCTNFLFHTF